MVRGSHQSLAARSVVPSRIDFWSLRFFISMKTMASVIAQLVKNLPSMQETPVPVLGQEEDPLEKG